MISAQYTTTTPAFSLLDTPTIASGLVGIQAGLLGEDNTFEVSFVVAPAAKYIVSSAATNGTVTLGSWFEIAF